MPCPEKRDLITNAQLENDHVRFCFLAAKSRLTAFHPIRDITEFGLEAPDFENVFAQRPFLRQHPLAKPSLAKV